MKYIALLFLLTACGPVAEPDQNISDWSEQTHSSKHHLALDTYTVAISYRGKKPNDTIEALYEHFPTNADIIEKEHFSGVPAFYATDLTGRRTTFINVSGINVVKATISANNIDYIRAQVAKQDSMMRTGK